MTTPVNMCGRHKQPCVAVVKPRHPEPSKQNQPEWLTGHKLHNQTWQLLLLWTCQLSSCRTTTDNNCVGGFERTTELCFQPCLLSCRSSSVRNDDWWHIKTVSLNWVFSTPLSSCCRWEWRFLLSPSNHLTFSLWWSRGSTERWRTSQPPFQTNDADGPAERMIHTAQTGWLGRGGRRGCEICFGLT